MTVFFEKKNVFILLKRIFNKLGGQKTIPVVASRLVSSVIETIAAPTA